ncbi:hypothetical protein ACFW9M_04760 [Streptomyces lydicus]|uniref:hypothetical protein n=1 Tax=Streptomyces lydicus TaxID=47763 RepID=UPI0036A66E03
MTLTNDLRALLQPTATAQSQPSEVLHAPTPMPRGWEAGVRYDRAARWSSPPRPPSSPRTAKPTGAPASKDSDSPSSTRLRRAAPITAGSAAAANPSAAALKALPPAYSTGLTHERGMDLLRSLPADKRREPTVRELQAALA